MKFLGTLNVTINEAQGVAGRDTYVKLYLNHNGKNVKASKQKTRVKKSADPIFEQTFRIPLTRQYSLTNDTKIEISLWDHARTRANECLACVMFGLKDIVSTSALSGWHDLQTYSDARKGKATPPSAIASSNTRADTQTHTAMTSALSQPTKGRALPAPSAAAPAAMTSSPSAQPSVVTSSASPKEASRRRVLAPGKMSKAQMQARIAELESDVMQLTQEDERHVQEKAVLEEKLQSMRESSGNIEQLKRKNAEMKQQLEAAKPLHDASAQLKQHVEDLELENGNLQRQYQLLSDDSLRHVSEIAALRDRYARKRSSRRGRERRRGDRER